MNVRELLELPAILNNILVVAAAFGVSEKFLRKLQVASLKDEGLLDSREHREDVIALLGKNPEDR